MQILSVEPKDIHITFVISATQIDSVIDYLNHCTAKYSSEDEPSFRAKSEYVTEVFHPMLIKAKEIAEEMKRGL